jgi:N-dimethylarginine dimethylaminohydrolase
MTKTVLMCPPTYFDVREPKNPYMGLPIDRVRARQQWENLCRALQQAGVQVETINPVAGLDDMVFAANPAFVGNHDEIGKFVVPSRMRYPSRHREVEHYVEWFRQHGYRILDLGLQNDEYLEGHGDLIWDPGGKRIWAAYGFRSTRGGVEKFNKAMQELGYSVMLLELVDPYCYHLDTSLCPLNAEAALIYPGAFGAESVNAIRQGFRRIHELGREEAVQFMGNGIVASGHFITPRLSENLSRILAQEQLTPLLVDTSEFEKAGGSVFCMKTFVE